MLTITVATVENFDESSSRVFVSEGFTVELEHSLASISKWESIYEKPFLDAKPKTKEETLEYIRCMALNKELTDDQLSSLTSAEFTKINEYINAKMTATWFTENSRAMSSREALTSELIYYWMTALSIPFECDKWHFARLLILIRVANQKNSPKKKMSRREMAAERTALNERRRAQYGTTG